MLLSVPYQNQHNLLEKLKRKNVRSEGPRPDEMNIFMYYFLIVIIGTSESIPITKSNTVVFFLVC